MGLKIKSFRVQNFKSVTDLELILNEELSILTGVNNCGKTTILEAIAFWCVCFRKLIHRAERGHKDRYDKGDFIFKADSQSYFDLSEFPCVHCAGIADIFPERDMSKSVKLIATLVDDLKNELYIPIVVTPAKPTRFYVTIDNKGSFDYKRLNLMLRALPNSIASFFATPVAIILPEESFQTDPIVKTKVEERKSIEVFRNRLYRLLKSSSFSQYCQDLSYILYGSAISNQIFFSSPSNILTDKIVKVEYWTSSNQIKKEIAMLGSGTLQIMEILLNLYHNAEEKPDLNIVLLDEPDSHIHRDVQGRLLEVLSRVTQSNQIILTTHNESMIREASLKNLFHIDASTVGKITCLYKTDLPDLHFPRFKGLYPGLETPLLQSITGQSTGLDFINAIEADKVVFVEGEDDARLFYHLMMTNIANQTKRIVFWVAGGVSEFYTNLGAYKTVFSMIKNKVSLWDKSVLVFDSDCLIDEHITIFKQAIKKRINIPLHVPSMYTIESVLLSDLTISANLLIKSFSIEPSKKGALINALSSSVSEVEPIIRNRYNNLDNPKIQCYKGTYINHINQLLDKGSMIQVSDIDLEHKLNEQYSLMPLIRLANKDDIADIINRSFKKIGEPISYKNEDFCRVFQAADSSLLFDEWKLLISFLSS